MLSTVLGEPDRSAPPKLPQVWRIPPWQPAVLILLATGLLALDLYGSLSLGPLLMTVAIAVAALVSAGASLRYVLVADTDGVGVRRLFGEDFIPWADVADIDVTNANLNAVTIRITRKAGPAVDVPTVLVQPTLPTNIRRSRAMVGEIARRLLATAAEHR